MSPEEQVRNVLVRHDLLPADSARAADVCRQIAAAVVHIGADADDLTALLDDLGLALEGDPVTRDIAADIVRDVRGEP